MDTGSNIEVLRKYFDNIAFRDLPNGIPMSWSANGISSDWSSFWRDGDAE